MFAHHSLSRFFFFMKFPWPGFLAILDLIPNMNSDRLILVWTWRNCVRAINRNSLTGQIPAALGNLGLMYWFDISENLLSGPLPVSTARANGVDSLTSAEHL